MADTRRFGLLLLVVVVLAGALRWTVADRAQPVELRGDEVYYLTVAGQIADGHGHRHPGKTSIYARRPPANPWLLAQFLPGEPGAHAEEDLQAVATELLPVQCLLGAVLVLAVGLLGRSLFDGRVGLVAAVLTAVDPTLVAFSHYFWSETLCAVLLTLGMLGIVRTRRSPSLLAGALTGLVLGLATLTREIAAPIVGIAAVWLVATAKPADRGRSLRASIVMAMLSAAVVLPWTWRNYERLGAFVPVSTVGWFATAEGNTLHSEHWFTEFGEDLREFRKGYNGAGDEARRSEFARAWAREQIAEEQPLWVFKKLARSTTMLLTPDSPLLMKLREGRYGEVSVAWTRFVLAASLVVYAGVLLLAVVGFLSGRTADWRLFFGLVLAVTLAGHVLANSTARFRVPWLPLAAVFAAAVLVDLPGTLRATTRTARIVAALFALYFLGICVPYSSAELAATWAGPVVESTPGLEPNRKPPVKPERVRRNRRRVGK